MKEYLVEITETLQRQLIIYASSIEEARLLAKNKYYKEEIVLNENDYVKTEFIVQNDNSN